MAISSWPVRLVLLLLGGATFEASARWWCSEHRYHHRYVDTNRDPYGINKGFWYAHIGWLIARRDREIGFENVKDLDKDPLILWQHRYYLPLAILFCFGLPTGIAALWGDPWGGLVVAGFARLVCVQHFTWCINSVAHTFGRQTYSDRHSAKDSGLMAFFTYGEGYHNFHHEFPSDYRNGHRWYHWDPAKWLIRCLAFLRLSRGLRQTEREKILQARLLMERKRMTERLAVHTAALPMAAEVIDHALAHLQSAASRWMALKAEYAQLKRTGLQSIADRVNELRREMHQARREFRRAISTWKLLIRQPLPVM
ncbi:MAG: fatty acid desaturase [Deltaproteobacteria bacterium]|nr:fatty acid desaturase [Deltaproteobacteria bacterium]